MTRALTISIAVVTGLLMICTVGCTKNSRGYTVPQIKQMRPFTATVTDIRVDDFTKHGEGLVMIIGLKKSDGSEFSIMEIRATPEQVAFARQLTVGHTYTFPQVILDHETTPTPKSP